MNVVLVSIGNFQPYILDNIRNLLRLKHKTIYVITNEEFKEQFAEFSPTVFTGNKSDPSPVKLVYVEGLTDVFHFYERSRLDKSFRDGFWVLTSLRLFYLYAFMEKYKINDVVHLENDVVIYYNCDELLKSVEKNKVYVTFNSFSTNVLGIIYIPNSETLKPILMNWDLNRLDMNIFACCKNMFPQLIQEIPIFKEQPEFNGDPEKRMVCNNYERFNKIFDGNAMGQYLGGIDPRNTEGGQSTVGFVNKECCIKYDKYRFIWKYAPLVEGSEDGEVMKKPFVCVKEEEIPIFNLHIHSKDVSKFVGGAGF